MGNRISKVYTKNGDTGKTSLADGSQIPKTHHRIKAFAEIDDLNSSLGQAISIIENDKSMMSSHIEFLKSLQNRLFDIGGEISIPGSVVIEAKDIEKIEEKIDHYNEQLKPLKNFILPGGSAASSALHVARTKARIAEIQAIECSEKEIEIGELGQSINPESLKFLNRISDLFFVMARIVLINDGKHETLWEQKKY